MPLVLITAGGPTADHDSPSPAFAGQRTHTPSLRRCAAQAMRMSRLMFLVTFVAMTCPLGAGPSRAGTTSEVRRSPSDNPAAQPASDTTQVVPQSTNLMFGMRFLCYDGTSNLDNLAEQLGQFQSTTELPNGLGFELVFTGGYKAVSGELDILYDDQEGDFFGGTHTISPNIASFLFWLRYRSSKVLGLPVHLSPGAAIGYTRAELAVWDKEGAQYENNNDIAQTETRLLDGGTMSYSVGVLLEVGWLPGLSVALDYRYMWARIDGMTRQHGAEFFFPTEPVLDYSGHYFGIGLSGNFRYTKPPKQ